MVNYKRQLCRHSFVIVDDKRPNLLGRDMLPVMKIHWSDYIVSHEFIMQTIPIY